MRGIWTIPGGVLEVDERAAVGATRELEEGTTSSAVAAAVELVHTDLDVENPDEGSILTVCSGMERHQTTGSLQAGDEPAAAEFWKPQQLAGSTESGRPLDIRCVEAVFEQLRRQAHQSTRKS